MANPNIARRSGKSRAILWLFLFAICAIAALVFAYREPIRGYAEVGTAYTARVACSCRFIAGRSLEDCEKDKLPGTELVTLVDDVDAKSVTARFPLVTDTTARYREGYGCVMEKWEG